MGKILRLIDGGKKQSKFSNDEPIDDFERAYRTVQKAKEDNTLECVGMIFRLKSKNDEIGFHQVHYTYCGDTVVLIGAMNLVIDQITAETSDELVIDQTSEWKEDEN